MSATPDSPQTTPDDSTGAGPPVAVVVPAQDCAGTIVAQLEALRRQECDYPFTVVVADNGSTDGTAQLAEDYCASLGWNVVDASARPGATVARNVGTRATTAPIVAYCDADDIASPAWLGHLVEPLQTDPRIGVVGGRLEYRELNPARVCSARAAVQSEGLPREMGYLRFASSANMAVRRSAFDAVGGWDEQFLCGWDDVDFAWRVQQTGSRIAWVGGAVLHYRLKPSVLANARQVRRYAEAAPLAYRKHRNQGARRRRPLATAYLWLGLIAATPSLATRQRRDEWLMRANRLLGNARGSVVHRVAYL